VVVGVNRYQEEGEAIPVAVFQPDETAVARQLERLAEVRRRRDPGRHKVAILALANAASAKAESPRTGVNLVGLIVEAVRARATLGEISAVLCDAFGKYRG
jgi:methylmalonyl-CoA mutase N-terminal domain/subunit